VKQPAALSAAVFPGAGTSWWKDSHGNFAIPMPGQKKEKSKKGNLAGFDDDLSRTIVDCEVNTGAWTLMHRCNKAADLLNDVVSVSGGKAKLAGCFGSLLSC
jgi:hypothetical protein